jgi:alanyl-tRNA synthetase
MSSQNPAFIIADHMRAAMFLIADGVKPSGKQQGYILRRLIRRSLSCALKLGIDITNEEFYKELIEVVSVQYADAYPEVVGSKELALVLITTEAIKYNKAIARGEQEWKKLILKTPNLSGEQVAKIMFDLYQTHGVPLELSLDILEKQDLKVDEGVLHKLVEEHQQKSQDAGNTSFKGGLSEHNDQTLRMHTATHILHQVLRSMFGTEVKQMGSALTTEKGRFDFSFERRLTDEEVQVLTNKIQTIIDHKLAVNKQEMTSDEARELGAIGLFGEKYGDQVTVYTIQSDDGTVHSREFCGGPHVTNTGEIGKFTVLKQKSVGAGVKRIEFTLQ